tara:strand:+ start:156 stop:356 length:201 start_codon:yes stop_codon:yes gene_type:complete
MKFKVKPEPQIGDKKSKIRFAFIAKRIQDHIVWLEKYECVYRYSYDRFWKSYYWEVCETKLLNKKD